MQKEDGAGRSRGREPADQMGGGHYSHRRETSSAAGVVIN